jgi:hypothetical protein
MLIELRLQHLDDDGARKRLQAQLETQKKKEEASRRIALAREQVFFGLAAHILDRFFQAPTDASQKEFFAEIEGRLPADLERFTTVFESTRHYSVAEYWGWSFWDSVADGQAHYVDLHSKPNRLYCVRALQLLARLQPKAREQLDLQKVSFLANDGNPQGLPAMLEQIRSQPERWRDILSVAEFGQIDVLLKLLGKALVSEAETEQEALITAEIDAAKLAEFKTSLIDTFEITGRLRPLMRKLGNFRDLSQEPAKLGALSWGFNQLDDKGAFIVQSRVSYPPWGESYGRGLGQAEDEIAFKTLTTNASTHDHARKADFIAKVEGHFHKMNLKSPILVQTLSPVLEYEGLSRSELFVPKYRKDCPGTPFNDLNGFQGILRLQGQSIPVFDLHVQNPELKNKVLLADLSQFAVWEQFSPVDDAGDEQYRVNTLLARVIDLNKDDKHRTKIITDAPSWLQEQSDPEKYLRSRVLVNVFEKFKIEILDPRVAVSIDIAQEQASAASS